MNKILELVKKLLTFLRDDSHWSSLRVYMGLITLPISAILWGIAYHVWYYTGHPVERTVWFDSKGRILHFVDKYQVIEWLIIGGCVATILGALWTMWYAKKQNTDAETASAIANKS